MPDLYEIETVMGEPAVAAPVQVFVGLASAPTMPERVELALAEMERAGAFDRSLLVLVSPTGLGYVNYVAMAAAQYLTLGDVASARMGAARSSEARGLTSSGWLESSGPPGPPAPTTTSTAPCARRSCRRC